MTDSLQYRGTLTGHKNWVTSIAATYEQSNLIVSASRDKKVMVWELTPEAENCGYARKAMGGHGEAVQDITLSSDGQFALSGSWDKTLRLWDLNTGATVRCFQGHKKTCSALHSQQTIARSCLDLAIRPSSCGTLWENASTLSLRICTLIG